MPRASVPTESLPLDPRRAVTLDEILGNAPLRGFLKRSWATGKLPQALLITGPPGVGKTTLAWALAREIVAEGSDPKTDPRARKIERAVHPDMIELTGAESASKMIRIDDVRALEDRAWTAPLESPRKIVLIEPAHRMTDEAANCLLKLLEEPPPSLLFFLVTPEPGRLLETIRSRATPIVLEPVPISELAEWVGERASLEPERARLLAALSEGRPGLALALAASGLAGRREAVLDALALIVRHGFAAVFGAAERLVAIDGPLRETFLIAMTLLRDMLVLPTRPGAVVNRDLAERLGELAGAWPADGLLAAAEAFERAAAEADYFYTPQSRHHLTETMLTQVGRALRGG